METSDIENGILGGDVEVREFWITVADADRMPLVKLQMTPALAALQAKQQPDTRPPGGIVLKAK
jgi:hypothetical protein